MFDTQNVGGTIKTMAFTIPDLTDNKLNSVQTRDGDQPATDDEVKFHRHCQKTVLSAYGPDGHGLTWNTINNLNLPYLPENWRNNFTSNTNNITEDLKALLNLINWTAGQKGSFTLSFKDSNNNLISNRTINLNVENQTAEVRFGRVIELKIGSITGPTAAKFNTVLNPGSGETTIIPQKKINFQFNNSSNTPIGSADVVSAQDSTVRLPYRSSTVKLNNRTTVGTMQMVAISDQTLTIPQDFNILPANILNETGIVSLSSSTYTIQLNPNIHVYRISATGNFSLRFDGSNYNHSSNSAKDSLGYTQ